MWKNNMKKIITFTDTVGVPERYKPIQASKVIPSWYSETQSYVSAQKKPSGSGTTSGTIKRCMPVFDAMAAGYILFTPADIFVSQVSNPDIEGKLMPWYEWANFNLIDFHPITQAPIHPENNGFPFPKFMNPWSIKTEKGYSIFITQPLHRESNFNILPAIVDTDKYTDCINFPFVLNDPNFEGLIPAGTPMAQVIPIKREEWRMRLGGEEELSQSIKDKMLVRHKFFDGYKSLFRQNKNY